MEEECSVPDAEEGVGEARHHELYVLRERWLHVILGNAFFALDALPDESHLGVGVRGVVPGSPVGLSDGGKTALEGAHFEPG